MHHLVVMAVVFGALLMLALLNALHRGPLDLSVLQYTLYPMAFSTGSQLSGHPRTPRP
jgi:hypothetical protein